MVKNFNNKDEFNNYILKRVDNLLGVGMEGKCFSGAYDNYAYKVMKSKLPSSFNRYKVKDIIMYDDVNIDSFLFPKELYVIDNTIVGYKTDRVEKDYFDEDNYNINDIDLDKFKDAYKVFYNDVLELSYKGINIGDMPGNIMFDGEKIYAIDTCMYRYDDRNLIEKNIWDFNTSVVMAFSDLLRDKSLVKRVCIKDDDIDGFIRVIKAYKEKDKEYKKAA